MDDLDDLQPSEFVTDTDDQDSLDERIDTEQRLRNQQLWASFQNAACCITKLYKDRTQPNLSPWVPFQNAASNLTTLYKDCIESQKRFARIGYQVGRRRRMRDLKKWLKKNRLQLIKQQHHQSPSNATANMSPIDCDAINDSHDGDRNSGHNQQQQNQQQQRHGVVSILAVNQLNLGCDELPSSPSHQSQSAMHTQAAHQHQPQQEQLQLQQQPSSEHLHIHNQLSHHPQSNQPQANLLCNTEEDLVTFREALVQPATVRGPKSSNQNRRPCLNSSPLSNRSVETSKSEEERLLELNQFLSEEYHRHVGSRKRSSTSFGGGVIKRFRD